jgi:ribulose-5-phosphate 4-epimerase/fuculose-1-phosphate aldolase
MKMFKQFQQLTWKVVDLVNSPQKTQRITRNAIVSRVILKEFIETAMMMDRKGFFAGSFGEISLRTNGGKFLITPRDMSICRINEETIRIAAIEKESDAANENLPLHTQWHREIYRNSNANAVVLCQPPFATVLANKMQKPAQDLLVDAKKLLDSTDFVIPEDVALKNKLDEEYTLFIQSIGILVWGKSLDDLLNRSGILERLSAISLKGKYSQ